MSRELFSIVAGFLALAMLVACENSGLKTVRVTEQNAGKVVQLAKGDTLEVTLGGNPSTGYMWQIHAFDTAVIREARMHTFKSDVHDPQMVGVPGKFTFYFEAVEKGQAALNFFYSQPWDSVTAPAKTIEITTLVK